MDAIRDLFAPDGALAHVRGRWEPRPGQIAMAEAIERGIRESTHTLVEAGTGVGKSFAYLLPALRSGKRVVVSTGTIALQERLVEHDIPTVARALGIEPRVALVKGRGNYLCRDKFMRQSQGALLAPTASLDELWEWALTTATGDRAELPRMPKPQEWEQLDADAESCLGEICGEFGACHYFRAKNAARDAQIIVVNHALFFLDLLRGGLLPPYDIAVLDEAHQCEHWATQARTAAISDRTVGRSMRRLRRLFTLPTEHDLSATTALQNLEIVMHQAPQDRYALRWDDTQEQLVVQVSSQLAQLRIALRRLVVWLESDGAAQLQSRGTTPDESARRVDLSVRDLQAHTATIELALGNEQESIAWIDRGDGAGALHTAPYDIAPWLRERLFERVESVTLTSATIAEGNSFGYIRRTLGVDHAQELVVDSPFDYPQQARIYLAPAQVNPKSPRFLEYAAPIVEQALRMSRGRAFVLCTSHARMKQLCALVRERIAFPVKIQGDHSPTQLLRWFSSTPNAVLFATGSFWEGIDVVGDALSCVIVDRLPFPSPADPLVAARIEALEKAGLDGFRQFMIPAAVVRLKQGFGRLIRSAGDRGLLVILDGRASSTSFGKTLIKALPPAPIIAELAELDVFFATNDLLHR